MTSPLVSLANLTCVFNVPTSGTQGTAADGTPTVATTQQVVIAAVNQSSDSKQRTKQMFDGMEDRITIEGNWVNPLQAIAGLASDQVAEFVMWHMGQVQLPESFADVPTYEQFLTDNAAEISMQGTLFYLPSPTGPADGAVGSPFLANLKLRSQFAEVVTI